MFDYVFLGLYIAYLGLLVLFPLILVNKVSIACRLVILMEQVSFWTWNFRNFLANTFNLKKVRLLMKSHAFVRSNTGKILRFDTGSAKSNRNSKKVIEKNFSSFFLVKVSDKKRFWLNWENLGYFTIQNQINKNYSKI